MREIIFRGKRLDNGEWVEGVYMPHYYSSRFGKVAAIFTNDDVLCKTYRFPVDPETVGQYTGLKDKNGKPIFEGDIVTYDNSPYNAYCTPHIGVIVWRKWAWHLKYIEYGFTNYYPVGSEDFFGAKSELIGNIHDNPESMGGSK